jgi:hypothetical protein
MKVTLFLLFAVPVFWEIGSNEGLNSRDNQQTLNDRAVLSGKSNMLIPHSFTIMDEQTIVLKYPVATHRPTEVYTNKEGTINIALNHTVNKATPKDLPEVKKVMEGQFNKAPFNFIKSELKEMNGSEFIVLEFVSPATDTKIYNLMAIASLEGRLVIITFNCTQDQRKEWEPIGKKIINSITLKK